MLTSTVPSSPSASLHLPEGAWLPTRLKVAWSALKILEKEPGDTIAGPTLNACLDGGVYAKLSRAFHRTEEGRALLTERPSLQGSALDLPTLARLPRGTVGREFAQYFEDNKLSPFESTFAIRNDVDYLSKRYRETHDLAHVLTGYRTDVIGEMELQAFMLGNLGIRTAALILTFSVVKGSVPKGELARKVFAAYRRGARSKQLIRVRYERHWETPVPTLCAELGIPPAVV